MHIKELIVSNNYELIEEVGEGAFGVVYKGYQLSTGQIVAIKTLKLQPNLKEQAIRQQLVRFDRETQLCAQINHPNIVKLLDKGFSPKKVPYAIFEFVKGETLKNQILKDVHLTPNNIGILMGQVLEALAYVHQKGIVHRDLKPSNIMVVEHYSKKYAKVLDFGIGAFSKEFYRQHYKQLTITNELLGTPTYSAPEQLRGEPPTVKSDLYAWGLIIIECLTKRPVMDGKTVAEVFQQQLAASAVNIPPVILDHPLGNLLKRVLDKNPVNRLGDARLALAELEQINFNTLTGLIQDTPIATKSVNNHTLTNYTIACSSFRGQKQLTILCLKLNLEAPLHKNIDLNILDTLQKDLLNQCRDIAARYGGYVAEPFMNNLAIYFGYPESNDSDARRAGRTALELVTGINNRRALLLKQYSLDLNFQMGMHSGVVLVQRNYLPQGNIPNRAFDLVYKATPGSVLISKSSKKLLDPFLEFEEAKQNQFLPNENTYTLVGERRTEAIYHLTVSGASKKMVGRNKEKQAILHVWDTLPFIGTAIIINGQAGIGKSRLTHEIKLQIQSAQHTIAECRCFPEHQNNALYPFLKMLRDQWGISQLSNNEKVVEALKGILLHMDVPIKESLSLLCSWLSIPMLEDFKIQQQSPEEQKKLLFKILKESILTSDATPPLLLVIEDLHWIDSTSIEFIDCLLSNIKQQPFMLLMTCRPEFKNAWQNKDIIHINLEVLKRQSILQMVQGYLGGKQVSAEVLDYINQRADGIPFFIEELVDMLLDQHYIELTDNAFVFAQKANLQKIPETIQDLLNAKLDRLNFAKETAQIAASIGREFTYKLLVKSSLKSEADIQSDLDLLTNADIIYQQRSVQDNNYFFKHALIRDAAYGSMLPFFRKETHASIADTLIEHFPMRVEENAFEVARHKAAAEQFDKAIMYGLRYVEGLVLKFQYHEASNIIQSIEQWLENIKDEVEEKCFRLKLNNLLLPVCLNTEGFSSEKFVRIYKENIEIKKLVEAKKCKSLVDGLEDIILKSKCLYILYLHAKDRGNEALKLADPILEKSEILEPKARLMLKASMGQRNFFAGNIKKAQNLFNDALKQIEIENQVLHSSHFGFDPAASTYFVVANMHAVFGKYDQTIDNLQKGIAYAHEKNSSVDILLSYIYRGYILGGIFKEKEEVKKCINELNTKHPKLKEITQLATLMIFIEDWSKQQTQKSLKTRQKCINIGETGYLSWYEVLIMDTLFKNQEYQKVYEMSIEIKNRLLQNNEMVYLPQIYNFLICSLYKIEGHETEQIIQLLNQAILLAKKQGNSWLELVIKYNYAKNLKENGAYQKAHEYQKDIKELMANFAYNNAYINSIRTFINT